MTDIEAAYIAGIIDGEGSMGIYYYSPRKDTDFSVNVSIRVVSTCEDLVHYLKETSKVGTIARKGTRISTTEKLPQWVWSVTSRYECLTLLQRIKPYLLVKSNNANYLEEALDLLMQYYKKPKPPKIQAKIIQLSDLIKIRGYPH